MSRLGKIFGKKTPSTATPGFWDWFTANQKRFQQLEKLNHDKALDRVNEIVEELKKINPWFKALIGKYDDNTSELIITSDGDIALFVKVEELVGHAPSLKGWRFTAHKPPMGFVDTSIEMYEKVFNENTVKFYPVVDDAYPDIVSIVFTHVDYSEEESEDFEAANSIYVQNALGEVNTATQLDYYECGPEPDDKSDLIPVTKLNDYLNWREKEFVEKYDHTSITFPEEAYNTIEGEDTGGNVMMAIVVSSLEQWPYKPAFCWWMGVQMEYLPTENGLPDERTLQQLHDLEDRIVDLLTIKHPIVYVASKTFRGTRMAYFYCRDYKTPSLLMHPFCEEYEGPLQLGFFIEKDKYWQRAEEFFDLDQEEEEEEED